MICETNKNTINESLNEHMQMSASRLLELKTCQEKESVYRNKLKNSLNRADQE